MKTHKIYEAYGALAHEKTPIYSADVPASEFYNVITLALPENWSWEKNAAGATLVSAPDGTLYNPQDILTPWGDHIALAWYGGDEKYHHIIIA